MMERLLDRIVRDGLLLGAVCAIASAALGQAAGTLAEETAVSPGGQEAGPEPALMLRLRSGAIQWARIEGHDPRELTVRRLDNGGLARLPWELLEPTQGLELRTRFGYVDISSEEPMTDGHRLVLIDGTELVGVLTSVDDQKFVLKSDGAERWVNKSLVRSATTTQVAALEVYTKDELYSQRLAELRRPDDPEAHYELARFLESILDFKHALEHYRRAAQLDPGFRPDDLAAILARVEVKVGQQEQLDVLAGLDRLRRRGLYHDALNGLLAFDAKYPDSPLRVDRLRLEDRIVKGREREVREVVRRSWYLWLERVAAMIARETNFETALAKVEDGMTEEIVARVTKDARRIWPDIENDQVRQMWLERAPGRWKWASYGLGTWLLGEEDALKGGPETKASSGAATTARDREREDLEEKMARFLKNQKIAKSARRSSEDAQEIEDFWLQMTFANRAAWLLAYYAENSGQLELRPKPELYTCKSCGGTGALEVINLGSGKTGSGTAGMRLEMCPTCKGIGRVRRIRFR